MYKELGVYDVRAIASDANRLLSQLENQGWSRAEAMDFVLNYFKGGKD